MNKIRQFIARNLVIILLSLIAFSQAFWVGKFIYEKAPRKPLHAFVYEIECWQDGILKARMAAEDRARWQKYEKDTPQWLRQIRVSELAREQEKYRRQDFRE